MPACVLQTGYWRSAQALWRRALAVTSGNYFAHNNLGYELFLIGRREEALEQYRLSLEAKPDNPEALNNLGYALLFAGRPAEAVAPLERAARLRPGSPVIRRNLELARGHARP